MSYMNLMAAEQGLGSCWCQMRRRRSLLGEDAEENVRQALGITDEKMRIVGMLALGMPKRIAEPHYEDEADWKKVYRI